MQGNFPWKELLLDEIPVLETDLNDAISSVLHTILFTRAPGPVRPSEATCPAFPNITYSKCAVFDVEKKVEMAIQQFEQQCISISTNHHQSHSNSMSNSNHPYHHHQNYHQSVSSSSSTTITTSMNNTSSTTGITTGINNSSIANLKSGNGILVVSFFERKVKKALFGLMSNEEKIYFEKWILPINVSTTSSHEKETFTMETETALQNCLLHILSAVQTIDHIPNAMYDFEIQAYPTLEAMQLEAYAHHTGGSNSSSSGPAGMRLSN